MVGLKLYIDVYVETCDEAVLNVAQKLGYKAVVCRHLIDEERDHLEVYEKIIIDAESRQELKKTLASLNTRRYFVTLVPRSIEVARWASHDTRIDSIMLTPDNLEIFDKKQFNTMSYYGKPVEISLKQIINADVETRGKLFRRLNLLLRSKAGLLVGSGASSWNELYHPFTVIKILALAYDIPPTIALLSITDFPKQIIVKKSTQK